MPNFPVFSSAIHVLKRCTNYSTCTKHAFPNFWTPFSCLYENASFVQGLAYPTLLTSTLKNDRGWVKIAEYCLKSEGFLDGTVSDMGKKQLFCRFLYLLSLDVATCNQRIFRPTLSATDGYSDPNYLQLNLQSAEWTCNHPHWARIICNWKNVQKVSNMEINWTMIDERESWTL